MCDTFIVLGSLTASGRTTLAKNSDREPNEAQYLTETRAADHAAGSMVRCTYIEIPEVPHTYAVTGSRPWWMWGFEHGVNECGLAIGNEAVWSRLAASAEPGLLGMDLLRLTLERAVDADEGFDVLTGLLETYGQSGLASAERISLYHNSFILADGAKAWVVQTAGRHWVAKRVDGWASISNVYSIGADYERISADAIAFAVESGWYDPASGKPFDFAAAYADLEMPALASCSARFALSQAAVGALGEKGKISLEEIFAVLRTHGAGDAQADWRPGKDGESVLCMHALSPEGFETAASMVAELAAIDRPDDRLIYWASLASPCTSTFVPVWLDAGIPQSWTQPDEGAADAWWDLEGTQRLIEQDYGRFSPAPRALYAVLEAYTIDAVKALGSDAGVEARAKLTNDIARRQDEARKIAATMTEACACHVLSARVPDLRDGYLDKVESSRPLTFRAEQVMAAQ